MVEGGGDVFSDEGGDDEGFGWEGGGDVEGDFGGGDALDVDDFSFDGGVVALFESDVEFLGAEVVVQGVEDSDGEGGACFGELGEFEGEVVAFGLGSGSQGRGQK